MTRRKQKHLASRDVDEITYGLLGGVMGLVAGNEIGISPGLTMIVGLVFFTILTMVFNHVVRVQRMKRS